MGVDAMKRDFDRHGQAILMFNQLLDKMTTQVKSNFGQAATDVSGTRKLIIWTSDVIIKTGNDGVISQVKLK